MRKKGFTLIELLIVISIIGVLATIILTSLNSARTKAKESAITSTLRNMINKAELSYDTTNNYSTACSSIADLLESINNSSTASSCYSHAYAPFSDINKRWGASCSCGNFYPDRGILCKCQRCCFLGRGRGKFFWCFCIAR